MEFLTQYNCGKRNVELYTNPGEDIAYNYHEVHKKDGSYVVEKNMQSGYSMRELINKYRDDVDIEVLYKRYLNGDLSAIDKNKGVYIDTTKAPKRMSDFLDALDVHKEYFDSMPVEYKELFNNDYRQFAVSLENGEGQKKFDEFILKYNVKYGGSIKKEQARQQLQQQDQVSVGSGNEVKNEKD